MKNALTYCEQDLMVYGGHSKAAGFTIDLAKLDDFISHMQTYANEHLTDEDLIPIYQVETVLTPQDITMDLSRNYPCLNLLAWEILNHNLSVKIS